MAPLRTLLQTKPDQEMPQHLLTCINHIKMVVKTTILSWLPHRIKLTKIRLQIPNKMSIRHWWAGILKTQSRTILQIKGSRWGIGNAWSFISWAPTECLRLIKMFMIQMRRQIGLISQFRHKYKQIQRKTMWVISTLLKLCRRTVGCQSLKFRKLFSGMNR